MTSYTDTILPPREWRGVPRWTIAVLVVLAAHLAIAIFIILKRSPDVVQGVPTDAVMIDLAPVETPAQPAQAAAPPQQKEVTPLPPPEPPPAPPILQTPELPKPAVVMPSPPVVAPPPLPKPTPDKALEQRRVEQQKRLEQEHKRKERAERLLQERAARAREAARARDARRAARPTQSASRQSTAAWARQVQARVNAAKRYPEAARARGESGTATLAFTVDASGRVVSAQIASSSGSSALDHATLSMAHRLGRLPPPPNGRITLRVKVNFSVR